METLADMTRAHRRALANHLPDGLIVVSAAPEAVRNGDVNHRYRQDSDFLWLTGVQEPGYALLIDPRRGEETLFVPKLTQEHAVWMGHIPSLGEARKAFGISDVRYADELPKALAKRARGQRTVFADRRSAPLVRKSAARARIQHPLLRDALDELRLFKDVGELTLMRKAGIATDNGHLAAMRFAQPGLFEYQVQAEMEREFHMAGCALLGYNSIVAAGRNGAVLHYHHNADKLRAGDLLLIDAAAEYRGYTADVTRTFPVSGRFTREAARRLRGGPGRAGAVHRLCAGRAHHDGPSAPLGDGPRRGPARPGPAAGQHGRAGEDAGHQGLLPARHRPHPGPRRARREGLEEARPAESPRLEAALPRAARGGLRDHRRAGDLLHPGLAP